MRIEQPDVSDADRLAELWVALAADQRAYGSYLLPEANRETIRESVARHVITGGLFVARDEGDDGTDGAGGIVGFVMFGPETGAYEQDVQKGVVQNIYVDPERRGEGIGGRLLAAAEDAMRADGAETIVLDVMARNERARAFYRRHGYHDHRVTMAKDDPGEPDGE